MTSTTTMTVAGRAAALGESPLLQQGEGLRQRGFAVVPLKQAYAGDAVWTAEGNGSDPPQPGR